MSGYAKGPPWQGEPSLPHAHNPWLVVGDEIMTREKEWCTKECIKPNPEDCIIRFAHYHEMPPFIKPMAFMKCKEFKHMWS